mmetsp:Transcript_43172/g.101479  ORF Transcript_43172/g.101479 Transcript_43172/m.101479 type:complete len:436 (+) Transcript_43172:91-1398(+)
MGDGASKPIDSYGGIGRRPRDTYSYWEGGGGRPLQASPGLGLSSYHDPYLMTQAAQTSYSDVGPVYDSYRRPHDTLAAYDHLYGSSSYGSHSFSSPMRGSAEVSSFDSSYWADPVRSPLSASTLSAADWQGSLAGMGTRRDATPLRSAGDIGRLDGYPGVTAASYTSYSPQSTSDWAGRSPNPLAGPSSAVGTHPQDTLLVWDWDDTLMCSSAINSSQVSQHQASQLDLLLEQVLSASLRLGETIIVTNADELWVSTSARQFTPHTSPLLNQIRVVSARRKFEYSFPGDPFAWKREAFREVLANRRNGLYGLNLVVLGDSPAEMEAAQTSTMGMSNALVKTVKFKDIPSVEDLLDQLRIIVQDLPSICSDDKSCSRNLAQFMRYGGGGRYASSIPQASLTGPLSNSFIPQASLSVPGPSYLGLNRSVLSPMAAQA